MANTSLSAFDLSGIVNSILTHFLNSDTDGPFSLSFQHIFFHFFAASILLLSDNLKHKCHFWRRAEHSSLGQLEVIWTQSSTGSKSRCLINPNVANSKQSDLLD